MSKNVSEGTPMDYAYVRKMRTPFWPISVPQRVGFSSNVSLRVLSVQ